MAIASGIVVACAIARLVSASPDELAWLRTRDGRLDFSIALYAFLRHIDDPLLAIRESVNQSRDSDTAGAITGAFVGAFHGAAVFNGYWRDELEFQDVLDRLGRALARQQTTSGQDALHGGVVIRAQQGARSESRSGTGRDRA